MVVAMAPIDDLTDWLRGNGLEIVLFVTGAILLARLVAWVGHRITGRIDASEEPTRRSARRRPSTATS